MLRIGAELSQHSHTKSSIGALFWELELGTSYLTHVGELTNVICVGFGGAWEYQPLHPAVFGGIERNLVLEFMVSWGICSDLSCSKILVALGKRGW